MHTEQSRRSSRGRLPTGLVVPLAMLLAPLLSGCPVYSDRPQTACEPGAGGQEGTSSCKCSDKVNVLSTGEPIPGMDNTTVPRRGGTLRIHLDANLPSLNRLTHTDLWGKRIVHHDVYQALVR